MYLARRPSIVGLRITGQRNEQYSATKATDHFVARKVGLWGNKGALETFAGIMYRRSVRLQKASDLDHALPTEGYIEADGTILEYTDEFIQMLQVDENEIEEVDENWDNDQD